LFKKYTLSHVRIIYGLQKIPSSGGMAKQCGELNDRGKVRQLRIGIEDRFMMGAKTKWIKKNLI
jgi:hypothetical protein